MLGPRFMEGCNDKLVPKSVRGAITAKGMKRMFEQRGGVNRGGGRETFRGRGGRTSAPKRKLGGRPVPSRWGLSVREVGEGVFELVHPKCVAERELDYQEGIELWRAGDPAGARDALRYALQGCGDNLWIHVALGQIALKDDHDPKLARGHFGYAFELAQRALPRGFSGRLPRERPANQPLYDAIEGLAACYEALGRPREAAEVRARGAWWSGARGAVSGS
jgi:tetratricopeptide (TPR) repeat protein